MNLFQAHRETLAAYQHAPRDPRRREAYRAAQASLLRVLGLMTTADMGRRVTEAATVFWRDVARLEGLQLTLAGRGRDEADERLLARQTQALVAASARLAEVLEDACQHLIAKRVPRTGKPFETRVL